VKFELNQLLRLVGLLIFVISVSGLNSVAMAGPSCSQSLTPQQVEQVRMFKQALAQVDHESLEATVEEFNKSACPAIRVLMLDAMTRTYADLIRDYDLIDQDARVRLYDKIKMNMAYMQFTGGRGRCKGSGLNCLIQDKLKTYLPSWLLDHPQFYVSIDE